MFEEEKICLVILEYIGVKGNKILEELHRKLYIFLGIIELIEEDLKNGLYSVYRRQHSKR